VIPQVLLARPPRSSRPTARRRPGRRSGAPSAGRRRSSRGQRLHQVPEPRLAPTAAAAAQALRVRRVRWT
jgi:hypothetical protein